MNMVKFMLFNLFDKLWQYKLSKVNIYMVNLIHLKGGKKCIWIHVLELGLVNTQLHESNIW